MYGCNISGLAFVLGMLVRSENQWLYRDVTWQTKTCSIWSAFEPVLPLWWWPTHLSRDNSGGSATQAAEHPGSALWDFCATVLLAGVEATEWCCLPRRRGNSDPTTAKLQSWSQAVGMQASPLPTRRLEMFGALFFIRQCKTTLHSVTKSFHPSGRLGPHKQWKFRWGILSPSGDPSKKNKSSIRTCITLYKSRNLSSCTVVGSRNLVSTYGK